MVVWVRIRIFSKYTNSVVETSAILNTGFGSPYIDTPSEPTIRIPTHLAELLGLWPNVPRETKIEEYISGGGDTVMYSIQNAVKIKVLVDDRETKEIDSSVLISPIADCVLINDRAIEMLDIVVVKPASGIWKFYDEEKLRKSAEPQFWE